MPPRRFAPNPIGRDEITQRLALELHILTFALSLRAVTKRPVYASDTRLVVGRLWNWWLWYRPPIDLAPDASNPSVTDTQCSSSALVIDGAPATVTIGAPSGSPAVGAAGRLVLVTVAMPDPVEVLSPQPASATATSAASARRGREYLPCPRSADRRRLGPVRRRQ